MMRCSSHRKGEALAGAPLDNAPKEYPPKIQQLVQDIASLTLLEISDLNELLKVLARRPTSWPLCGGGGSSRLCLLRPGTSSVAPASESAFLCPAENAEDPGRWVHAHGCRGPWRSPCRRRPRGECRPGLPCIGCGSSAWLPPGLALGGQVLSSPALHLGPASAPHDVGPPRRGCRACPPAPESARRSSSPGSGEEKRRDGCKGTIPEREWGGGDAAPHPRLKARLWKPRVLNGETYLAFEDFLF